MTPDERLRIELDELEQLAPDALPPTAISRTRPVWRGVLPPIAVTVGAVLLLAFGLPRLLNDVTPVASGPQTGASITPAPSESTRASAAPSPAATLMTPPGPSFAATPNPPPPEFTVSWTEMPWSGRVSGVSFDAGLALWMAFGPEGMWTSRDGVTWQRHTFEGEDVGFGCPDAATWMVGATRMAGKLWAAGTWDNTCDLLGLLMWSSTDGATWEVVPQGQLNLSVTHAVASNGSILAVASSSFYGGDGIVRTSPDGRTWTGHQPGGPAEMLDVYGDGDGFVAVGSRLDGAGTYTPAIWSSAEGSVWVDVSPTLAQGELRSIVREPGGAYLAAGVDDSEGLAVWRSETGGDWIRVTLDGIPVNSGSVWPPVRLASSDRGLGLVVLAVTGWQFSTSPNGVAWSPMVAIPGDAGTSFGPYAAMSEDQIIVFPPVDPESGDPAYVLIGRLEPVV